MTPNPDRPDSQHRDARRTPSWWPLLGFVGLALVLGLIGVRGGLFQAAAVPPPDEPPTSPVAAQEEERFDAPPLEGGVEWLNCSGPLTLKDLRGKIVVLDFWTLCCINCIHTLPDLAKLEEKYKKQVVVIGVHSPKFENEKDSASIRQAILRYEISHPVVNDAEMKIWKAYDVHAWPTLVLIDPEGKYVGYASGEGNYELLDRVIEREIKRARERKTLDEEPMRFDLIRNRVQKTPLFFPGKVLADAKGDRLFIADSTHHRVVVTDLSGKKLAVIGQGTPGWKDGSFAEARFDDPQGMALRGETLYVADRKNHLIRAVDLKAKKVETVAGTGEQERGGRGYGGKAREVGLNSPWDLHLKGDTLFIAMAGHHQIWTFDLKSNVVAPYAGDGRENIKDGPLFAARFAQPSGLASDGENLYVADCEVSAIRQVPMDGEGRVKTLVGEGLFEFGDIDGVGDVVRLQHALGVAYHNGKLYVADTYNNKIKLLDPATRRCETWLGGEPGGWFTGQTFDEPAGLSIAGGKLYVADTNAHRVRVVDLKTKKVSTLQLEGVEPPSQEKS